MDDMGLKNSIHESIGDGKRNKVLNLFGLMKNYLKK